MSLEATTDPLQAMAARTVAGRYRIEEELGAGGWGTVYRARDLVVQIPCAIKVLHTTDEKLIHHFASEFAILSKLRHPGVVAVYDFGVCAELGPYFTMELVPGKSIGQAARFDTDRRRLAMLAARQLLEALDHVHGCGVVHADVKPTNVLSVGTGEGTTFKLGDFGLASSGIGHARGTVLYMAPEVVKGGAPDARADLYSLGLTLLECLLGRPPFSSTEEKLRNLSRPVLDLVSLPEREELSRIKRLLRGLLEEDPRLRFRSAREALSDYLGDEILPAPSPARSAWGLPFVGRDELVAALESQASRAVASSGESSALSPVPADAVPTRVVVVTGTDGVGKSRMLRELASRLQLRGVAVALATGLRSDIQKQWQEQLRPARRRRGDRPLDHAVLLLDDAHACRAPRDRAFLGFLAAHAAFAPTFLVVAGRRQDALAELLLSLEDADHAREERLGPLDTGVVSEAVVRMLGGAQGAAEVAGFVAEASGGVPRLVEAALLSMERSSLLIRNAGRWLCSPLAAHQARYREAVDTARAQRDVAQEDLEAVELEVVHLLSLAGGAPLPLDALEHATSCGASALLHAVAGLRERDPVSRACDAAGTVMVFPELLRGAHPPDADRRARRLARRLVEAHRRSVMSCCTSSSWRPRVARSRACDAPRGGRGTDAGARAPPRGAMARVVGRDGRGFGGPPAPCGASVPLGGAPADGLSVLARIPGEMPPGAALTILEKADALEALGDYDQAAELLASLPQDLPVREACRAGNALMWIRMMQGRYDDAERLGHETLERTSDTGLKELEASVRTKLGSLCQMRGDHEGAIAWFSGARDLHGKLGALKGIAAAENGLGTSLRQLGRVEEAASHLKEAVRLLEEVGELASLARAEANLGNVLYAAGDWKAAEERWRRGALFAIQAGDAASQASSLVNVAEIMKEQGRLSTALAAAQRARRIAAKMPRIRGHATISAGDILSRLGRSRDARRLYREAHGLIRNNADDLLPVLALRLAELALSEGKARRADRLAVRTVRLVERRRAGNPDGGPPASQEAALAHRLRAVLRRADHDPGGALSLLEAGRNELVGSGHDMVRARLAAEEALCHRDLGNDERSRRATDVALEIYAQLGALPEMERLRAAVDKPREGVVKPADWVALMDVVRAVTSELSLDRSLDTIVDKSIEISGAERGFLVLLSPAERRLRYRSGRDAAGRTIPEREFDVSMTVVNSVVDTGRPIALADIEQTGPDREMLGTASVHRLGLRTVLCVPIRTREQAVMGAIYVDSVRAHRPFEPSDIEICEALAGQAGIAIVNARLYEDQRRKNEMVSIVSHELRGPLTSIKCYVELLRMNAPRIDDAKRARFLELMDSECMRLSRLVENILDLSRLEAGKAAWSVELVDLGATLSRAAESLHAQAEEKGVALAIDVPPDLPPVPGNGDRILQVVLNLVNNAVKFTPSGGHVRASAMARNVTGTRIDFVEVQVSDDGVGIDPSQIDRLFEKFSRVTVGGASYVPGIGLGLSIAKEIVESHGGKIWVASEPGKGSTFAFHLPVRI
ncbi:MAG: ATP-binding protein [Acidobacteriota bacterium]